jgi:hypothetical protein
VNPEVVELLSSDTLAFSFGRAVGVLSSDTLAFSFGRAVRAFQIFGYDGT